MSEQSKKDHDTVVAELLTRLKERKGRGIKTINKGGYENPDKIMSEDGSGRGFVPDITSSVPSFIIAVEDAGSLESAGEAWKAFSVYARKTYREFIIAVPGRCADQTLAKVKGLKIRNAKFIWY
jgi:hypothetical protein